MELLAVALCLQASAPETREERVLALLEEVARSGTYRYQVATFREEEPRLGEGPVVVSELWVTCGNADEGTFDDVAVRRLAAECLRIYGLEPSVEHEVHLGGCQARLDGVDLEARVGFELVGLGCRETFCEAKQEPPEVGLDADEAYWLARQGLRLHIADVASYRGYGEEFAPTLAYLAGLVRFLNGVTEGEDVELGGLLFERERAWDFARLRFEAAGVSTRPDNGKRELIVEQPVTLTFECPGGRGLDARPFRVPFEEDEVTLRRCAPMLSTRGKASALCLEAAASPLVTDGGEPDFRLRVRQTMAGVERVHESTAWVAFLSGDFDLAAPFVLELELGPGRYWFHEVLLGAPAIR
jgi:hypothetical protein